MTITRLTTGLLFRDNFVRTPLPGTAHRYWRVNITGWAGTNYYPAIGDLVWRATPGGPQIAVGGTPSASTEYSPANAAQYGFDGTTAFWSSSGYGLPAWLSYDFGAPVSIVELALTSHNTPGFLVGIPNEGITSFDVQYSDDNIAWTTDWTVLYQTGWREREMRVYGRPDVPGADWTIENGTWVIDAGWLKNYINGGATTFIRNSSLAARVDMHTQVLIKRGNSGVFATLLNRRSAPGTLYLFDIGAGTADSRMYRQTAGGYTLLGGIASGTPVSPVIANLFTFSTLGTSQVGWIDGIPQVTAGDTTVANQAAGWLALTTEPTAIAEVGFKDVIICSARLITMTGVPSGYRIRAGGGGWSAVSTGPSDTLVADPQGAQMPLVVEIADSTNMVLERFIDAYGGDTFSHTGAVTADEDALPAVAGQLLFDILPSTFSSAAQVEGTPVTAAVGVQALRTHIAAYPKFRSNVFPTGKPSVRNIQSMTSFNMPNVLNDDWTVYIVVKDPVGYGIGVAQWYNFGAFIDNEIGGVVNDFGVNLRADGVIVAGTGGDASVVGTVSISDGLPHILAITRKRSTGAFKVYVDGVLDITFNNNTNLLNSQPRVYFGVGGSVGHTSADFGRIVAYDATHSDPDRTLIEEALDSQFITDTPNQPVITLARTLPNTLNLVGSPYSGIDAHQDSEWQVAYASTGFGSPLADVLSAIDLESTDINDIPADQPLIARVRYRSVLGKWSLWSEASDPLAGLPLPPGTPFSAPVVFPFEPDSVEPTTEVVEYKTDVITSHNDSESRQSLRRRPVLRYSWRVTAMDLGESIMLVGALWKTISNRWYVPLWSHAQRIIAVDSGVYTIDTTDLNEMFSGLVMVWRDSQTYDVLTVDTSSEGSVTLTGPQTFDHVMAMMVPLGIGSLTPKYSLDRLGQAVGMKVEFEIDTINTAMHTPLTPAVSFAGHEVMSLLTDSPDEEHEQWTLSSERSGGELGPFVYRAYGSSPVVQHRAYWVLSTRAERAEFREWLAARRGRRVPFWAPSYQQDFNILVDGVASATTLDILDANFANRFFGSTARVHLAALLPDRTIVPMTVEIVTQPSPGVERLFLADPLPVNIPKAAKLAFLVFVRLSEDGVTLEHANRDVSIVSTIVTELPRETPV